jgi:hypothetical protein
VARAVWLASSFTSAATTAKPRPASPARAASIVAFSASRLVWPAMVVIIVTTSPIRAAAPLSSCTRCAVDAASSTAAWVRAAAFEAWRPISWTEVSSSSAAEAAVLTLAAASSAALATRTDWLAAPEAVLVMVVAVACRAAAAPDTVPMMPPTAPSKASAIWRMPVLRCSSAACRAWAFSVSRARARIRPSLKTWTEAAMAPISSRRPAWGTATDRSCAASRAMAAVMDRIGRATPRRITRRAPAVAARPATSRAAVTVQAVV